MPLAEKGLLSLRFLSFIRATVTGLILGSFVAALSAQMGWQIPQAGRTETSPLRPTADVLEQGSGLYAQHCASCHGKTGKGPGPQGDPEYQPADLTDEARASVNPDGVLFYKIFNGRRMPKMPPFKNELTKEQIWTVVEYVKSLRAHPDSMSIER